MLHILNGSAIEEPLRQSSVPEQFFSFRDVLIAGPVIGGLNKDQWRQLRVEHLASTYDIDPSTCDQQYLEQTVTLESSATHDEVVLWFEHDLFCQLNLLYLLDWFAHVDLAGTKLSLVNIGEFPGKENFHGLGELNEEELASLFPQRQTVSATQLETASEAWRAFSSPDPTVLESILNADTSSFPFLSTAVRAHLRRFPNTTNGLGHIENKSLELVAKGREEFADLFPEFISAEPVYGLGDTQLWLLLVNLSKANEPLLTTHAENNPTEFSPHTSFRLTDAGKAVLNGESDFVKLNGVDHWLGGVHLQGSDRLWRWDTVMARLRYC